MMAAAEVGPAGTSAPVTVISSSGGRTKQPGRTDHTIRTGLGHTNRGAARSEGAVEESWSGGGSGGGELERWRQRWKAGGKDGVGYGGQRRNTKAQGEGGTKGMVPGKRAGN